FARYPTLSVGYVAAILRNAGIDVSVVSPLARGVGSYKRITRPHMFGQLEAILRHYTAVTGLDPVRKLRDRVAQAYSPARSSVQEPTVEAVRDVLARDVDLVMISAYTMYKDVCADICAEAQANNVAVIVGGPMFTVPEVTQSWLSIPGLTGVYVGEPEADLADIIAAALRGPDAPCAGLVRPGDAPTCARAPLSELDTIPFPDYSDFPWDRYPNTIIPMMTGRGCGWGVCTFCSDVLTAAGRTYRSRSPENVLGEMRFQSDRHKAKIFTFLDLKLNSNLAVWHALIDQAQATVPGCEWTASVHVNINGENGLDREALKDARKAGLSRITTGLESGSQKILNSMARGTNTEMLSQFVRYASEAGISVRMTSIIGYPGETSDDVKATTSFLKTHYDYIDRIVVNRLAVSPMTPLGLMLDKNPARYPQIRVSGLDLDTGLLDHDNATFRTDGHLAASTGLLRAAHRINRKPLHGASLTFEGVL
ncbi:MAG: radical SAM protein, partial [Pseudomonadota bacterium]